MRNFVILIFTLISIFLAGLWFKSAISPVSKTAQTKTFVIPQGASLSEISKKLKKEELIKNALAFRILASVTGQTKKIQAGSFGLSPHLSAKAILKSLTLGTFDVWITIPEGWRVEEIAQLLNSKLGINQTEFINVATEGFMFPDTYLIPKKASAAEVAQIMRDNFDKRVDANLQRQIEATTLTLEQLIILASIVEREVKFDSDRPIVAGILAKRWKADFALEADATVQYALGYQESEKSWWKKTLILDDLEINSPYNTRKFAGLPPTPICNPGLASIAAVVSPEKTEFFYYLSDKEGKMHYAKTLSEHIENINKFL